MRRGALAAALAATLGATPVAADVRLDPHAPAAPAAPTARAEAERHAAEAKARFDAHDYAGAIEGYGAAYRRLPSPGLLFNLAQAHRLRGNCAAASLMYHEYLRAVPDSPHREVAERHLAALADCSHRQAIGGGAGDAGVVLRRGGDTRPGRGKRVAGIAVGTAGVALVLTGAYLLSTDADDGGGNAWGGPGFPGPAFGSDDHDDDDPFVVERPTRRSELVGAGLLGAGIATVATGVTLYALGRRDEREARRPSVAITPTRGGVTAQVGWRF